MSWIRVDCEIADDPKITALAYKLKKEEAAAIGFLVALFAKMAAHARTGDLSATLDATIEKWARWTGRPGVFASAFRELFAPDGIVLSWYKHNGAALEKAETDARRKRATRAPGAETARAAPQDVRGTGRTDGTDGTTSPSLHPGESDDLPPVLKAAVPEADQVFLYDLLNRVPYRLSWIRAFEGALQGIHYKPISGAQLAQAAREFLGNIGPHEKPNMRWFEQHVRTIANGETPRSKRGRATEKINVGLDHLKKFAAEDEVPVHGK